MSSDFMVYFLAIVLTLASLFMVLLVLVQRGRGGGLAGAFGGMGGQSAFGTRAGDVFTKITVVVAILFIVVAALLGIAMRANQRQLDSESERFNNPEAAENAEDLGTEVPLGSTGDDLTFPESADDETTDGADSGGSDDSSADADADDGSVDEATGESNEPDESSAESGEATDDADSTDAESEDTPVSEEKTTDAE